MSRLFLIRHGQASFLHEHYDQLSVLGVEQARALGEGLAGLGLVFDRIYTGTLQRHLQTADEVAAVYRARSLAWPAPALLPAFDEHRGHEIMEQLLPSLAARDATLHGLVERTRAGQAADRKAYFALFQQVLQQWVRGEIAVAEDDAWPAFRRRVQIGIEQLMARDSGGQTVAIFTSGGPIAVALGVALRLSDEQIIELSWGIRNASLSEFLFSAGRFSMRMFNAPLHQGRPELLTYV